MKILLILFVFVEIVFGLQRGEVNNIKIGTEYITVSQSGELIVYSGSKGMIPTVTNIGNIKPSVIYQKEFMAPVRYVNGSKTPFYLAKVNNTWEALFIDLDLNTYNGVVYEKYLSNLTGDITSAVYINSEIDSVKMLVCGTTTGIFSFDFSVLNQDFSGVLSGSIISSSATSYTYLSYSSNKGLSFVNSLGEMGVYKRTKKNFSLQKKFSSNNQFRSQANPVKDKFFVLNSDGAVITFNDSTMSVLDTLSGNITGFGVAGDFSNINLYAIKDFFDVSQYSINGSSFELVHSTFSLNPGLQFYYDNQGALHTMEYLQSSGGASIIDIYPLNSSYSNIVQAGYFHHISSMFLDAFYAVPEAFSTRLHKRTQIFFPLGTDKRVEQNIDIYDSSNVFVRNLIKFDEHLPLGTVNEPWDGTNSGGQEVNDGKYELIFTSKDVNIPTKIVVDTIYVVKDNTPPLIKNNISSPIMLDSNSSSVSGSIAITSSSSTVLEFTPFDQTLGYSLLEISLSRDGMKWIYTSEITANDSLISVDFEKEVKELFLVDGMYKLSMTLKDTIGNARNVFLKKNSTTVTTLEINRKANYITLSPVPVFVDGTTHYNTFLYYTILGSIGDTISSMQVSFIKNGVATGITKTINMFILDSLMYSGELSFDLSDPSLSDGVYDVQCTLFDTKGNESYATTSIIRNAIIPKIVSPANNDTVFGDFSLDGVVPQDLFPAELGLSTAYQIGIYKGDISTDSILSYNQFMMKHVNDFVTKMAIPTQQKIDKTQLYGNVFSNGIARLAYLENSDILSNNSVYTLVLICEENGKSKMDMVMIHYQELPQIVNDTLISNLSIDDTTNIVIDTSNQLTTTFTVGSDPIIVEYTIYNDEREVYRFNNVYAAKSNVSLNYNCKDIDETYIAPGNYTVNIDIYNTDRSLNETYSKRVSILTPISLTSFTSSSPLVNYFSKEDVAVRFDALFNNVTSGSFIISDINGKVVKKESFFNKKVMNFTWGFVDNFGTPLYNNSLTNQKYTIKVLYNDAQGVQQESKTLSVTLSFGNLINTDALDFFIESDGIEGDIYSAILHKGDFRWRAKLHADMRYYPDRKIQLTLLPAGRQKVRAFIPRNLHLDYVKGYSSVVLRETIKGHPVQTESEVAVSENEFTYHTFDPRVFNTGYGTGTVSMRTNNYFASSSDESHDKAGYSIFTRDNDVIYSKRFDLDEENWGWDKWLDQFQSDNGIRTFLVAKNSKFTEPIIVQGVSNGTTYGRHRDSLFFYSLTSSDTIILDTTYENLAEKQQIATLNWLNWGGNSLEDEKQYYRFIYYRAADEYYDVLRITFNYFNSINYFNFYRAYHNENLYFYDRDEEQFYACKEPTRINWDSPYFKVEGKFIAPDITPYSGVIEQRDEYEWEMNNPKYNFSYKYLPLAVPSIYNDNTQKWDDDTSSIVEDNVEFTSLGGFKKGTRYKTFINDTASQLKMFNTAFSWYDSLSDGYDVALGGRAHWNDNVFLLANIQTDDDSGSSYNPNHLFDTTWTVATFPWPNPDNNAANWTPSDSIDGIVKQLEIEKSGSYDEKGRFIYDGHLKGIEESSTLLRQAIDGDFTINFRGDIVYNMNSIFNDTISHYNVVLNDSITSVQKGLIQPGKKYGFLDNKNVVFQKQLWMTGGNSVNDSVFVTILQDSLNWRNARFQIEYNKFKPSRIYDWAKNSNVDTDKEGFFWGVNKFNADGFSTSGSQNFNDIAHNFSISDIGDSSKTTLFVKDSSGAIILNTRFEYDSVNIDFFDYGYEPCLDFATENRSKNGFALNLGFNVTPQVYVEVLGALPYKVNGEKCNYFYVQMYDDSSWNNIKVSREFRLDTNQYIGSIDSSTTDSTQLAYWNVTGLCGSYPLRIIAIYDNGAIVKKEIIAEVGDVVYPNTTTTILSPYKRADLTIPVGAVEKQTNFAINTVSYKELAQNEKLPSIIPNGPIMELLPSGLTFPDSISSPTLTYRYTKSEVQQLGYSSLDDAASRLAVYLLDEENGLQELNTIGSVKDTLLTLTAIVPHFSYALVFEGNANVVPSINTKTAYTSGSSAEVYGVTRYKTGNIGNLTLYLSKSPKFEKEKCKKYFINIDAKQTYSYTISDLYAGDNYVFAQMDSMKQVSRVKITRDIAAPHLSNISTDKMTFKSGSESILFGFNSNEAGYVNILLKNQSTGSYIYMLNENICEGENEISWDGLKKNGIPFTDGTYSAEIIPTDFYGNSAKGKYYTSFGIGDVLPASFSSFILNKKVFTVSNFSGDSLIATGKLYTTGSHNLVAHILNTFGDTVYTATPVVTPNVSERNSYNFQFAWNGKNILNTTGSDGAYYTTVSVKQNPWINTGSAFEVKKSSISALSAQLNTSRVAVHNFNNINVNYSIKGANNLSIKLYKNDTLKNCILQDYKLINESSLGMVSFRQIDSISIGDYRVVLLATAHDGSKEIVNLNLEVYDAAPHIITSSLSADTIMPELQSVIAANGYYSDKAASLYVNYTLSKAGTTLISISGPSGDILDDFAIDGNRGVNRFEWSACNFGAPVKQGLYSVSLKTKNATDSVTMPLGSVYVEIIPEVALCYWGIDYYKNFSKTVFTDLEDEFSNRVENYTTLKDIPSILTYMKLKPHGVMVFANDVFSSSLYNGSTQTPLSGYVNNGGRIILLTERGTDCFGTYKSTTFTRTDALLYSILGFEDYNRDVVKELDSKLFKNNMILNSINESYVDVSADSSLFSYYYSRIGDQLGYGINVDFLNDKGIYYEAYGIGTSAGTNVACPVLVSPKVAGKTVDGCVVLFYNVENPNESKTAKDIVSFINKRFLVNDILVDPNSIAFEVNGKDTNIVKQSESIKVSYAIKYFGNELIDTAVVKCTYNNGIVDVVDSTKFVHITPRVSYPCSTLIELTDKFPFDENEIKISVETRNSGNGYLHKEVVLENNTVLSEFIVKDTVPPYIIIVLPRQPVSYLKTNPENVEALVTVTTNTKYPSSLFTTYKTEIPETNISDQPFNVANVSLSKKISLLSSVGRKLPSRFYNFEVKATNYYGISETKIDSFEIDNDPPTLTNVQLSGAVGNDSVGNVLRYYTNGNRVLTLLINAEDVYGEFNKCFIVYQSSLNNNVDTTEISINGSTIEQQYTLNGLSNSESRKYRVIVQDKAGNEAVSEFELYIDNEPPVCLPIIIDQFKTDTTVFTTDTIYDGSDFDNSNTFIMFYDSTNHYSVYADSFYIDIYSLPQIDGNDYVEQVMNSSRSVDSVDDSHITLDKTVYITLNNYGEKDIVVLMEDIMNAELISSTYKNENISPIDINTNKLVYRLNITSEDDILTITARDELGNEGTYTAVFKYKENVYNSSAQIPMALGDEEDRLVVYNIGSGSQTLSKKELFKHSGQKYILAEGNITSTASKDYVIAESNPYGKINLKLLNGHTGIVIDSINDMFVQHYSSMVSLAEIDIKCGDFDNDGYDEIAVLNKAASNVNSPGELHIYEYENSRLKLGTGIKRLDNATTLTKPEHLQLLVGDVADDGADEIIIAQVVYGSNKINEIKKLHDNWIISYMSGDNTGIQFFGYDYRKLRNLYNNTIFYNDGVKGAQFSNFYAYETIPIQYGSEELYLKYCVADFDGLGKDQIIYAYKKPNKETMDVELRMISESKIDSKGRSHLINGYNIHNNSDDISGNFLLTAANYLIDKVGTSDELLFTFTYDNNGMFSTKLLDYDQTNRNILEYSETHLHNNPSAPTAVVSVKQDRTPFYDIGFITPVTTNNLEYNVDVQIYTPIAHHFVKHFKTELFSGVVKTPSIAHGVKNDDERIDNVYDQLITHNNGFTPPTDVDFFNLDWWIYEMEADKVTQSSIDGNRYLQVSNPVSYISLAFEKGTQHQILPTNKYKYLTFKIKFTGSPLEMMVLYLNTKLHLPDVHTVSSENTFILSHKNCGYNEWVEVSVPVSFISKNIGDNIYQINMFNLSEGYYKWYYGTTLLPEMRDVNLEFQIDDVRFSNIPASRIISSTMTGGNATPVIDNFDRKRDGTSYIGRNMQNGWWFSYDDKQTGETEYSTIDTKITTLETSNRALHADFDLRSSGEKYAGFGTEIYQNYNGYNGVNYTYKGAAHQFRIETINFIDSTDTFENSVYYYEVPYSAEMKTIEINSSDLIKVSGENEVDFTIVRAILWQFGEENSDVSKNNLIIDDIMFVANSVSDGSDVNGSDSSDVNNSSIPVIIPAINSDIQLSSSMFSSEGEVIFNTINYPGKDNPWYNPNWVVQFNSHNTTLPTLSIELYNSEGLLLASRDIYDTEYLYSTSFETGEQALEGQYFKLIISDLTNCDNIKINLGNN